jgi:anhydro-N-acetylmuramic acid kinase
VQLGCAHTIAEMTGIPVVADFRTRDLIVGGQGAPFAPIYHQALFKNKELPLAVINIGGIANITYLPNEKEVSGYDIGPGNCLMDTWIYKHQGLFYDAKGAWAQSGKMIPELLDNLLADDYFKRKAPKSLGKEYFSLDWLSVYLKEACRAPYRAEDVQATLLQLTAHTIADSVLNLPEPPKQILICGGGVYNEALLAALEQLLPKTQIASTARYQIHPEFVEALMMAWLAEKTIEQTALNLSAITGAKSPSILGIIYPPGIDK